jgi:hypothetical protein
MSEPMSFPYTFPPGGDWLNFLPAIQAFLQGGNPYLVGKEFYGVYEPFWTYILLAPFALLPFWVGRILLFLVSLVAFAVTAVKMGASKFQLVMFLCSTSVFGGLYSGNIDFLVTLGYWMPPQFGLFFVLMKPQIGVCIAIYWMYMAWNEGGVREILRVFAPITGAYLLSFFMYGFWPGYLFNMPNNPWNWGLFPYLVPIGIFLLYKALQQKDKRLAGISSPLVAPYVTGYNFSIILLSLFNRPALFLTAWAAIWITVFIRAWLM